MLSFSFSEKIKQMIIESHCGTDNDRRMVWQIVTAVSLRITPLPEERRAEIESPLVPVID